MIEPSKIKSDAAEMMESAVMYLDDALARIRAGKASARILDVVKVEYYGQMSPLANVATITTPDARTIQIQPWEKKMIAEIERAIINSSIGLAPSNNGESIRLMIPPLTEERRKELAKQCKAEAENAKVSILWQTFFNLLFKQINCVATCVTDADFSILSLALTLFS